MSKMTDLAKKHAASFKRTPEQRVEALRRQRVSNTVNARLSRQAKTQKE